MQTPVALQFRFLVIEFLLLSAAAIAQDTASLTGTIRDNTGAVLPDACVTLKNTATGIACDLKTNPAGEYVAAAVPPNCPPLAAATKGIVLFNCGAYTQTQGLTFGNSGRNRLNNPHRTNLDMSVFKVFKPKENVQVQFRAEAFNVFNTPSGTA